MTMKLLFTYFLKNGTIKIQILALTSVLGQGIAGAGVVCASLVNL